MVTQSQTKLRFTEIERKEQTLSQRKLSNHKRKINEELHKNNLKTKLERAIKCISIHNYFKHQWTECFYQKTESGDWTEKEPTEKTSCKTPYLEVKNIYMLERIRKDI